MKLKNLITLFTAATLGVAPLSAQAPGVPIEKTGRATQATILANAKALREAGKLTLNLDTLKKQLVSPAPGPLVLPPPKTHPLSGRDVAEHAREGYLQFGWYYLCNKCDNWHISLAGAYAIAEDALATCHHCVEAKSDMREGYLIAVNHAGEVLPVTAVLAKSATMDAAILRVDGKLKPLPLNESVAPGDPAYCYSEPLGQQGYFSDGIVNRFYWRGRPGTPGAADEWKTLRVNVSTDWAPGSSGAAVVDQCGNVIGHVSTISPLSEGPKPAPATADDKDKKPAKVDRFGGATLITLHEAVPARGVLSLARELRDLKPGAPIAKIGEEKPAPAAAGSLKVGDPAPKLAASKWVQGEAVAEFARDKAYLVEFWATWCGPCKVTIPHLNALHKKYAGKGLVVIGQNVWEQDTEKVAAFVKEMGEKMSYRVALDTVKDEPGDGAMSLTWMRAAGQNGIPAAFLVGKDGRIAWIGHPSQLKDATIEEVLGGQFDVEKGKRMASDDEAVRAAMQKAGVRLLAAVTNKEWDQAQKLADEFANALPDSRKILAEDMRFRIAVGRGDAADAARIAGKVAEAPGADSEQLNNFAWTLVVAEGLKDVDFALAEKLARKAMDAAPADNRAHIQDTLARVLFRAGKKDEAVKMQEQAIAGAGEELKKELIATLDAYKKGELPPAN